VLFGLNVDSSFVKKFGAMMNKILFLLATVLLAISSSLQGGDKASAVIHKKIDDAEMNTPLLDISAIANTIVAGCVNVTSGNYNDSDCDLVNPGANSLALQRSFNSASSERGSLCHGWDLNLPSRLTVTETVRQEQLYSWNGEPKGTITHRDYAAEMNDRGAKLFFTKEAWGDLQISQQQLDYGVTNCGSGTLNSRTNIKNRQLGGYYCRKKSCSLYAESGEILHFRRISKKGDKAEYAVSKNVLPSGNSISYEYDRKDRLTGVIAKGREGQLLSHLNWKYPERFKDSPELTVSGEDGSKVHYKYTKLSGDQKHHYVLTKVIRDGKPQVTYEYGSQKNKGRKRMVKKSLPANRYLAVKYFEKGDTRVGSKIVDINNKRDPRIGRVSALYAPVGSDDSPIRTWSFIYNLEKRRDRGKPIGGNTETFDALGHRKVYKFSTKQRLTAVEHFLDSGELYRKERIEWGYYIDDEDTFLKAKGFTNGANKLLVRRDYTYDPKGNVLEEALWGNLSGNCLQHVKWDSYYNAEKYSKKYTYTKKGLRATEFDGRKTIAYQYLEGTDLLTLKLVYDASGIRERYHYDYDSNGTLIREAFDDGSSADIKNLTGVTEQHIKLITPTTTYPIGLPRTVLECVLNRATGEIELIAKSENSYSKQGRLTSQKVYDCAGVHCYTKRWRYDGYGNVIEEVDPLGHATTSKYDQSGNCIEKQGPDRRYRLVYTYDHANRLIKEEKVSNQSSKERYTLSAYKYDYLGNRTAVTDRFGNVTKYTYDEFCRLIEKSSPPALTPAGGLERAIDKVSYDCMNNPTLKVDSNGRKARFKYTAWGKPYEFENPDKSIERCTYNLDGTLHTHIAVNGVQTIYIYDYNGRKIQEEKLSPAGKAISVHKWKYNAFHLLEETDPSGMTTAYTYDHTGRLVGLQKGDFQAEYRYDSLGRKSETREIYAAGKCRKTICQYDALNRVIYQAIKEGRNLLSASSYIYDEAGNCTHKTIHDNDGDSCIETAYDIDNRPIRITNPDGSQVCYEYIDDFANELGQTVAYVREIDSEGNQLITISDTRGRLAQEERIDPFGVLQQKITYIYDGEGNLICRSNHVIVDGETKKQIATVFQYDSKNREISVTEAYGAPTQKISLKEYTPSNLLAKLIKPDGVTITYEYDDLLRLTFQRSSDGSIDYAYSYDKNSNIVKVDDAVHDNTTRRQYDKNNRMIGETLATGGQFAYQYDALARVKQLTLPDHSAINYSYDAAHLKSVSREVDGKVYIAEYDYNLSGRVRTVKMANGLGEIEYLYDSSMRTQSIQSPYYSMCVPDGGYNGNSNLLEVSQEDAVGVLTSYYSYDSLQNLISEEGAANHSYCFDSRHNRIAKDETAYKVNMLNQLTRQGDVEYLYDPNGNRLQNSGPEGECTYQYDALDRLIAVTTEGQKTEYLYDAFNRRLKKISFAKTDGSWEETQAFTYLFQGDLEIGACDKDNRLVEMRTLGLGIKGEIGAAALLEIDQKLFFPIHDYRGNVVALVDANDGKLAECYRYSAYGEEQIFDSAGSCKSAALSPWRFSSKRVDPETGWVYYGQRYYDAAVGRWTTPDPLGFKDGHNLYCFVLNRPMKYIDPDGRFVFPMLFANQYAFENQGEPNFGGTGGGAIGKTGEWIECPSYETCANAYCGSHFSRFPMYSSVSTVGTPIYKNIGIGYINGIFNSLDDARGTGQMLSDLANGHEVTVVHNASFGLLFDPFECFLGLCGVITTPAFLLAKTWHEALKNPDFHYLQIAHSQGEIHTMNSVAYLLDPSLRERLHIVGIAPGGHIPNDECGSSMHYESRRDVVPLFHKLLSWNSYSENTIMLEPHPDAPLFDHTIWSPTYQEPLRERIGAFIEKYGRPL
jgi:RHS repeat-associated protein